MKPRQGKEKGVLNATGHNLVTNEFDTSPFPKYLTLLIIADSLSALVNLLAFDSHLRVGTGAERL